jgi:hypothetical protein
MGSGRPFSCNGKGRFVGGEAQRCACSAGVLAREFWRRPAAIPLKFRFTERKYPPPFQSPVGASYGSPGQGCAATATNRNSIALAKPSEGEDTAISDEHADSQICKFSLEHYEQSQRSRRQTEMSLRVRACVSLRGAQLF